MSPSALFEALSQALHASDVIVDKGAGWASGHIDVIRQDDPVTYRIVGVGARDGHLAVTIQPAPDQTPPTAPPAGAA